MSKRDDAIAVMTANKGKSFEEVVPMIAAAIDVSEAQAKSYYKWIVKNGRADGAVPEKKAKEATVKPAAKARKAKDETITGEADEVAAIRKKNLDKLKQVGAKFQKGKFAEPEAKGVEDFDPDEARAEVEAIMAGADERPAFMQAD